MPTIDNWRALREALAAGMTTAELVSAGYAGSIRSLLDERDRLADEVEALRADAARLNWLDGAIFVHRWNGVIDSGSRVNWSVAGDYRHTCNNMVGNDFRAAIDAAMKGKP